MELCKKARVPMDPRDKQMNPTKKLLGDKPHKQFVILQR
ncbi:hypothetical protein Goklo_001001, partial [Gossypium klotzschianum]|nr:hypothetical protein [Gossypium klotzschianum]